MHLIPTKKEEWQNLVVTIFKAYVIAAYIVWKLSSLYISGDYSPFVPPVILICGYVFSIMFLSFVAGIQKGRKQSKAAAQTLIFIIVGVVFLSMSFQAVSILRQVTFLAELVISCFVFLYAFGIRRFQKNRVLTFWIWGSAMSLIKETGFLICNYLAQQSVNYGNGVSSKGLLGLIDHFPTGSFIEFYWLGFLLTEVLYIAGIILAIQKLQEKDRFSLSSNTAMFVALGFFGLMILMVISSVRFKNTSFLPNMVINAVLLYFCLRAYRKLKLNGFLCLSLAAIFAIAQTIWLFGFNPHYSNPYYDRIYTFEQWVEEMLQLVRILATILFGSGIIFIIQSIYPENKKQDA